MPPHPTFTRTLVASFLLCLATFAHADEFDTLRLKWVDMLTGGSTYNVNDPAIASGIASVTNTANSYWNSLNKSPARTALWSDLASTTISAQLDSTYTRLRAMALAYATTGSPLKGNAALRDDLIGALDWLNANRYNPNTRIYDNWFHFEIGIPTDLNDMVAFLYDDLSPDRIANYMAAIEKFTPSATTQAPGGQAGTFTGANRMSKIRVVLIRGLLVKDEAKLRAARDAFSELFLYVTTGDGFYTDGSFIQHRKHPYNGSYGAVLMNDMAQILALINGPNALNADGATWKVTDPNLANVFRWVYDSYEPLFFRGAFMPTTQGRAVSRSGSSDHVNGHGIMQSILRLSELAPPADRTRLRAMLKEWALADTSRNFASNATLPLRAAAQQLVTDPAVVRRGELLGNTVFAGMDRVAHQAHDFALGLSMSSTRIYAYESINNENLHGWHTGDGMLYLYNADLTQFADSFWPTVNPRRLPGTTVDATQTRANASGQSVAPGFNWAGGATLGLHGAAGMQLDGWSNSLTAKKSWFMFDDEVVCLGSGVTSTDNRPIETIVENRLLDTAAISAFTVDGVAQPTSLDWTAALAGVHWAHLSGRVAGADIGYYFPAADTSVQALREARTGAWSDINATGSTTKLTRNYLTLWFDHGPNPANATYAYALLPNRTAAQTADYAARPDFVVLENSPALQAVRETKLGITAANFWNDGRATVGGLTVDRKASVLVQEKDISIDLALSDPTQANTGSILVELASAAQTIVNVDPGITVAQLTPTIRLSIDVKGARGRTFRARLATGEARPRATLSNLSTRASLATRDDVLIAGFVVRGAGTKPLLIRAVGPALGALGVAGALANPRLAIVDQAGIALAENDDWGSAPNASALPHAFAAAGAFALSAGSRDAALLVSLPAGTYSAVVRSADASSGIALVEVYDPAPASEPRLVNLSSRVFSGAGPQTAIVGFALAGDAPRQVLVRAAGPTLAGFDVAGTLPDPLLRVANAQGATVTENDNWSGSPLAADVTAMGGRVGAFAFGAASKDAATLVALGAGSYTALVSDAANRTGSALIEVYAAP